jgi:hypothetical protein
MVAQSTTRHTGESTSEAAFRRQLDKVKSGVSIAEAPNKEAAEAVHREAHGLVADEIVEVKEGS